MHSGPAFCPIRPEIKANSHISAPVLLHCESIIPFLNIQNRIGQESTLTTLPLYGDQELYHRFIKHTKSQNQMESGQTEWNRFVWRGKVEGH